MTETTAGDLPAAYEPLRRRMWRSLQPVLPALVAFYAIQLVSFIVVGLVAHSAGTSLPELLGQYDVNWYAEIAEYGYRQDVEVDANGNPVPVSLAFFPLLPALASIFVLVGIPAHAGLLLVSLIAGGAAAWGLHVFGTRLGGPRVGTLMAVLWAVAPGAIVLRMGYSESVFVALAVWTLVALERRQWLAAGGLTLVAGLSRSTAVALVAAVGIAALIAVVRRRDGWRPWVAAAIAPLGLAAFLLYVGWKGGRIDTWFWIQNHAWHMGFDGGELTWDTLVRAFTGEEPMWSVILAVVVVASVGLLVASWFIRSIPLPAHVYTAVMMASALGTGAFWNCRARFLLPAITIAVPVAFLLARAPRWVSAVVLSAATVAGAWWGAYLMAFAELNP
ncbi:glycosyltransferase family 39 protein [Prauserella rugosa]|uniref:Dolichyl-phosphate-mannose-protein mannosyltransferase n=1 Tax=Prauserella rugosa TaxID=43354 RepID=A0A660CJM7_9PSEU|nr:glycosyltransferase family 39 protein [Prauserella rugosa]KMS72006.1 hypothetical protein ACZ91_64970 [Streptomyces regensis]TWH21799.1 hypothetical protein JD82_03668 [Prauserella rugosa]